MNPAEFSRLAADGYNRIPLALEAEADLETPLSAYLKLARASGTFLFESVVGGERFGRYSYIGLAARTRLSASGRDITVERDGVVVERVSMDDPLEFVRGYLARFRVPGVDGLPRFHGGLVGYLGYEAVRWIEPRLAAAAASRPDPRPDPMGCPDMLFLLCEELAVFDNLAGRLQLIVYADPAQPGAFEAAGRRLRELRARLARPVDLLPLPSAQRGSSPAAHSDSTLAAQRAPGPGEFVSNLGEAGFMRAVARAREYVRQGDALQVVLSQRLSGRFEPGALALYRALRALNPSPYMFHMEFGAFQLVGASPEILVRLEGDAVTVRPIAGTRRRGATPAEDARLEQELLADEKERAEHVMLVDLGRNDVGHVCTWGSVRVSEFMGIERYSHVMHIVSHVEGVRRPDVDAIDVLRAAFPAGTVSGAPKVRAMEIIDELEPERRGLYSGAVGWIGFNGDMDMAITIRSGVVKDGRLYVQAGAGIVADSDPAAEWRETGAKAGAVLRAAQLACEAQERAANEARERDLSAHSPAAET